jgi:hypothetical protein
MKIAEGIHSRGILFVSHWTVSPSQDMKVDNSVDYGKLKEVASTKIHKTLKRNFG